MEEEGEVEEPCDDDDDDHELLKHGDDPYQSQDCVDTRNVVRGQTQNQEDVGGGAQCQNGGCSNLQSLNVGEEEENLYQEGTVESPGQDYGGEVSSQGDDDGDVILILLSIVETPILGVYRVHILEVVQNL